MPQSSLALLEIPSLTAALVVADHCSKSAGVRIIGIESTMGVEQCIKLAGSADDVREAAQRGAAIAAQMGSRADVAVMPGPQRHSCGGQSTALIHPVAGDQRFSS